MNPFVRTARLNPHTASGEDSHFEDSDVVKRIHTCGVRQAAAIVLLIRTNWARGPKLFGLIGPSRPMDEGRGRACGCALLKISSSAMLCEALLPPANLAKPCYPPCETGQERSTRGADGLETAHNARRTPKEAIKRTPRLR